MNFDYKDYENYHERGLKLFLQRITNPFYAMYNYIEYKRWYKQHKKKKFQRMLNLKSSELFPLIEWKKDFE